MKHYERWRLFPAKFPMTLLLFVVAITAAAGPIKVEPIHVFDVHDSLPPSQRKSGLSVQQFEARTQGLYYLLSPRPGSGGGSTVVLHTDDRGTFQATIVPGSGNIRSFDVDDRGNVFVLRTGGGRDRGVRSYDPRGNPLETYELSRAVRAFCVVDGVPLVAGYDGFLYALAADNDRMIGEVGAGRGVLMSALRGGRFVLTKRATGAISVGTAHGGVERTFRPNAPEIANAPQSKWAEEGGQSPRVHTLVYSGVATGGKGDIYVSVTGHKVAEGAVVLRLSDRGEVLESLRLSLPRFPELAGPGNPEGYMAPSYLGITDEAIVVVGGGSGKAAVYPR